MKRCVKNTGFTMIEATIAMVILAVAAAGILLPFGLAAASQDEAAKQVLAANLGTELMEKVLMTEPNAIVATYEANGYPPEGEGAMLDAAGATYTGSAYAKFSRSVQCASATITDAPKVPMVVVTVVVNYDGREMTRLMTMVKQ